MFEDQLLAKAFRSTQEILRASETRVALSVPTMKMEVSDTQPISLKADMDHLCCSLLHIGGGTTLPEGTALCFYSENKFSQQYRLRRCEYMTASNCAEPIWCTGNTCFARFEGRPKKA